MSKELKIVYENNDIKVFYNKKQFFSFTYRKEDTVLGAQAISDTLLAVYKVKYHPKNIERLIKEALREKNIGLRIEIVEKDKSTTIVDIFYNGKVVKNSWVHPDWLKDGMEGCFASDISRTLLKKVGVKYHPENIKRILKVAYKNRKIIQMREIDEEMNDEGDDGAGEEWKRK